MYIWKSFLFFKQENDKHNGNLGGGRETRGWHPEEHMGLQYCVNIQIHRLYGKLTWF